MENKIIKMIKKMYLYFAAMLGWAQVRDTGGPTLKTVSPYVSQAKVNGAWIRNNHAGSYARLTNYRAAKNRRRGGRV